jgi:DNA polymerase-3 subunit delta
MSRDTAGIPPVTYFYGEDAFMMEKAVADLVEGLIEEDSRPFDLEILFADETDPDEVAASANRLPFMAGKRVVVLRRMEKWPSASIKALTERYLTDPSPDTCLILCYAAKPDRRKNKLFQALEKAAGLTRPFNPTGERQLISWVNNYFRKRGMDLEPGAAETVVEYLGSDLHRLKAELQKVELFHSGKTGPVTVLQLEEMLKRVTVEPAWDLAPLLALGEKQAALSLLIRLLENGDEAIQLLGLLAGHYRRLHQARAVMEEGGGPAEWEQAIDAPRWLARKLLRQLRSLDDQRLAESISHLVWADRYLKRAGKEMAPAVMTTLAARLLG